MITRRLVVAGGLTALGGCGFRPLYGKYGGGGAVAPELASIYVAVMSERQGQLLRQALQQRLAGAGEDVPKQYELTGSLAIASESIGIQQDTSSNRVRLTAIGYWTLSKLDLANTKVTSGQSRVLDGVNVNDQQYFAVDLETSAAYRRLAESVANAITLDLAAYFRTHPTVS